LRSGVAGRRAVGSTFTVVLPLAADGPAAASADVDAARHGRTTRSSSTLPPGSARHDRAHP
jgi:hypothetical protein